MNFHFNFKDCILRKSYKVINHFSEAINETLKYTFFEFRQRIQNIFKLQEKLQLLLSFCILYPVKPYFNDIYIHQKRSCVAKKVDVVKDTNHSKAHQTNVNQQSIAFTVTCAVSILKCLYRQFIYRYLSQIIFLHPKHYLVSQDNIKQKHKGCISRASSL